MKEQRVKYDNAHSLARVQFEARARSNRTRLQETRQLAFTLAL